MKLITALLFPSIALAQIAATAQTPAAKPHAVIHRAATESRAGCVKLPELSPKVPALPTGAHCARALYTLTAEPSIKTDYVSPLEGDALRETLGIESSTFSLDYIDTKIGTGELAQPHKWFTIQYDGYLVDGTKFDSSHNPGREPFTFEYGAHQVVAGWDTGFAGMRVGGKRRIFIPWQLAYGPNGKPPIPGKAELVFDLEFLSESDHAPAPKVPPAASAAPRPTTPKATVAPEPKPATAPKAAPEATPSSTPSKPQ